MEIFEAINNRVSIRHFTNEQISDENLKTIIEAGSKAPIGMSKYQDMHITIIQDKKLLDDFDKAAEQFWNQTGKKLFHGAPTGILISGKPTGYYGMEYDNGACIIENMLLTVTSLNLGAVYLKGVVEFFDKNPEYLTKLNLPAGFIPLAGLAIGKPDNKFHSKPKDHTIKHNII